MISDGIYDIFFSINKVRGDKHFSCLLASISIILPIDSKSPFQKDILMQTNFAF